MSRQLSTRADLAASSLAQLQHELHNFNTKIQQIITANYTDIPKIPSAGPSGYGKSEFKKFQEALLTFLMKVRGVLRFK